MTDTDILAGLVRPLVWKPSTINFRPGECFHADANTRLAPYAVHKKHDGWWLNSDQQTHPTLEAAQAAANADHAARVLASLDTDKLRALVAAAILDAQMRVLEQKRLDTPDEIRSAARTALQAPPK
jgi:hypothetical protein